MILLIQRHFGSKNISWSKLSHYRKSLYRLCHGDTTTNPPTDSSLEVNRTVGRLPDEQYRLFLKMPEQPKNPKILKVSIIGEPNSGKSTLVNKLLGWRVNAVSSRVHTTRKNTSGMLTEGNTQIVFVDTPGVITAYQRKRHHCDANMLTDPEDSINEVDAVGVVVDASNKWTRTELNREVLKILHLHPEVKSFLILNKVDSLKKRNILLEMTRRLTCGVVGGHEMTFPSRIKKQSKDTMINMNDKYFSKLEQKYGVLKHKKKTSSAMFLEAYQQNLAKEADQSENMIDQIVDTKTPEGSERKRHDLNSVTDAVNKNTSDTGFDQNKHNTFIADDTISEHLKVNNENRTASTAGNSHLSKADTDTENSESQHVESDGQGIAALEESYQSEFLRRLRANAAPSAASGQQEIDTSWTEKMERIREASQAKGWGGFDRVFMVSALHGEGTDEIMKYLFEVAKPGPWEYSGDLVTPEHPHDIARMCVWQCLLEHVPDWLPYSATPEILFWHVDEHDRLDIVIEVIVDCQLPRFVGPEGETVKKISHQARQALLDAFQCEISFKLMFKQRSRHAAKQRS